MNKLFVGLVMATATMTMQATVRNAAYAIIHPADHSCTNSCYQITPGGTFRLSYCNHSGFERSYTGDAIVFYNTSNEAVWTERGGHYGYNLDLQKRIHAIQQDLDSSVKLKAVLAEEADTDVGRVLKIYDVNHRQIAQVPYDGSSPLSGTVLGSIGSFCELDSTRLTVRLLVRSRDSSTQIDRTESCDRSIQTDLVNSASSSTPSAHQEQGLNPTHLAVGALGSISAWELLKLMYRQLFGKKKNEVPQQQPAQPTPATTPQRPVALAVQGSSHE